MFISICLILLGFVLLMFGGDKLVDGAVGVARRLHVSPLVIGVVLVGFGTSVPELVTSIEAALQGSPGISIGNVIGSNIANVLLVAGAGALLIPIASTASAFSRDNLVLMVATLLFVISAYSGLINRVVGGFYTAALVIYVIYVMVAERQRAKAVQHDVQEKDDAQDMSTVMGIFLTFIGIALTIFGAKVLVIGATDIAKTFGVSETVIGVTIVALGTSLPELATAVAAGVKGEADVSIGNIIGSNIYNIFAILGITSIITPLTIDPSVLTFDIWVMVAATLLMIFIPAVLKTINRSVGALFLLGYFGYLTAVYILFV